MRKSVKSIRYTGRLNFEKELKYSVGKRIPTVNSISYRMMQE